MTTHPFRAAIERGASPEEFATLFTSNVTFHTLILEKTVIGRDEVLRMVLTAAKVVDNIHYTQEMRDAQCTILLWQGTIDGYKLQAATVLVDDAAVLMRHLTVLMRPWLVVTHVRDAMRLALPATLPANYWVLGAAEACFWRHVPQSHAGQIRERGGKGSDNSA